MSLCINFLSTRHFPPYYVHVGEVDPLVDDSLDMCTKIRVAKASLSSSTEPPHSVHQSSSTTSSNSDYLPSPSTASSPSLPSSTSSSTLENGSSQLTVMKRLRNAVYTRFGWTPKDTTVTSALTLASNASSSLSSASYPSTSNFICSTEGDTIVKLFVIKGCSHAYMNFFTVCQEGMMAVHLSSTWLDEIRRLPISLDDAYDRIIGLLPPTSSSSECLTYAIHRLGKHPSRTHSSISSMGLSGYFVDDVKSTDASRRSQSRQSYTKGLTDYFVPPHAYSRL